MPKLQVGQNKTRTRGDVRLAFFDLYKLTPPLVTSLSAREAGEYLEFAGPARS